MQDSKYSLGQKFNEIYFRVTVFLAATLPVIIITVATALLVRFIQKRQKTRQTMFAEAPSSVNQQQRHELDELTVCLTALAISFLVLVVPFTIWSNVSYTNIFTCSLLKSGFVLLDFNLLNSAVNFFIYYWKLAPFRKAIQKVCHCKKNEDTDAPKSKVYSVESPQTSNETV